MLRSSRLPLVLLRLLMAVVLVLGPALASPVAAGADPLPLRHGGQQRADLDAGHLDTWQLRSGLEAAQARSAHGHHDHPATPAAGPHAHAERSASLMPHAAHDAGDRDGHHGARGAPGCCGPGNCWMACHPLLPVVVPLLAMPVGVALRVLRETPDPTGPALEVAEPPPRAVA
ncbi:hypothetical protein V5F49_18540 [Xanthobacter sp. V3C-3]|uniref:hypothetical protein n=1 Tax=Xanthobacter lutulentifluminis TaxID=3119935 RepID=UPI0037284714